MAKSVNAGPGQSFGGGVEDVASVEAPGEAVEVALGMLGAHMMIGSFERGLDVAEGSIDPSEWRRAACLPDPVIIGQWRQPAVSTARQQDRPSVTTLVPSAIPALASFSTSFLRKPLTTVSLRRRGLRSSVVSTAATNGVLPVVSLLKILAPASACASLAKPLLGAPPTAKLNRADPAFALGEVVDRQEPKNGAGGQRHLPLTAIALKHA